MCRQRSDHVLTKRPRCGAGAASFLHPKVEKRYKEAGGGERLLANHSREEAGVSTHRQGI